MNNFLQHPLDKTWLKKQSIYLLPNLFTLIALFSGFFSIIQSINHHFEAAAFAIFAAMIFDSLDGRIARLTHSQSAFGVEFDSLSDMVSFGVAPAVLSYIWMLKNINNGWMIGFIFCSCTALRLARFNTMAGKTTTSKRWFIGMPSPAAAAVVAGFVWVCYAYHYTKIAQLDWIVLAITTFAGISMVVNIPFWSFKEIHFYRQVPFIVMLGLVLAILLFVYEPPLVFFASFLCYSLSGYIMALYRCLGKVTSRRK